MVVRQDLKLDVAGVFDKLLEVDPRVAEGRLGFGGRHGQGVLEGHVVVGDAHALAAAARGRLHQDGKANLLGDLEGLVGIADDAVAAGNHRHAGRLDLGAARRLVAAQGNGFGAGPDEVDVAFAADLGELGVLGEKAVAGMDGLGVVDLGRRDDAGDVQVAFARRGGPDADALVGQRRMQAILVGLGVHGDGGDAHLAAGADHAHGDLAPIRY